MTIDNRIKAFVSLGNFLNQFSGEKIRQDNNSLNNLFYNDFEELIKVVHIHNPWFTEDNVRNAVGAISRSLNPELVIDWISPYLSDLTRAKESKHVAVIMAGNIPLVGFHDMLCVLISGNKFIGKLSSDDKLLLPFLAKIVIAIEPEFIDHIVFTTDQLKKFDAVIATGSNNSARYFEYYFGKYPTIIRKNRNSIAVLTGAETTDELSLLGNDVFQYFGLGCRNVSKLFVPKGYKFDTFYESVFSFKEIVYNNKYANNYEYNRTVYLMSNNPTLLDNNFLLLKEDAGYSSPIGVLFYEYYNSLESLNHRLENEFEQIQCIVSNSVAIKNAIPFGHAQCPQLNDYADGIDTMKFLIGLDIL
ncbi:MAG: acyl-CoA reductase [Bacteroidetes bacterium RIFCSPLOWO2_12_FULL_35_15]|nr:MAG: acyl-CoA reductase [Bacteroidetes bacterium RIFCSPLOWO2_12_FULL_35_15]